MPRVLAMIMAGGAGTRLSVLSEERSKPSVPFAAKYRIIDFALSNCVNSGIYDVAVLTQYRPHSLNQHIGIGRPWDLDRTRGGVRLLHPYQAREGHSWYGGTANAVYQNLDYVRTQRPDEVVILSGDHIYKMDYRPMLRYHERMHADLTIGVMNVPVEETDRFGIMGMDPEGRITAFYEKPKAKDKGTLASMGIYVFDADDLLDELAALSPQHQDLDFGKHVIPAMIKTHNVYGYAFEGYWVDVGTVQSYWETNLALVSPNPPLDLNDPEWIIHTPSYERPPVKVGLQSQITRTIIANGCTVRGRIEHSVISPGVFVSPEAVVRDSIIMNDTWIGPGAVVDCAIVDKEVVIGANTRLGYGDDMTPNRAEPDRINTGITVVGKGAHIPAGTEVGRNVVVRPWVGEAHFAEFKGKVPSGETVG